MESLNGRTITSIAIESKPVFPRLLPVDHLYLVATDSDNNEWVIRGGPSRFWGLGSDLAIQNDILLRDSIDQRGRDSLRDRNHFELSFTQDLTAAWNLMVQQAKNIEAPFVSYGLTSQNSNSLIASVLQTSGVSQLSDFDSFRFSGFSDIINVPSTLYGTTYDDGSSADDVIVGQASVDIMYGLGGDDKLLGNSGNDQLYGNQGIDQLWGGSGRDWLNGYGGDFAYDELTGGTEADTFVLGFDQEIFYQGEGYAKILDWTQEDRIQLGQSVTSYTVEKTDWLGFGVQDVAIKYQGDIIGVVINVEPSQLTFV